MSTMRRPNFEPRSIAFDIIMTSSKLTVTVLLWPNRIMPPVSEHAQDIHAEAIGDDRGSIVVGGKLRDLLALAHLAPSAC